MTETLHLEGLEFVVTRSGRRRTVGVTVERDGDLCVAAPEKTPLSEVAGVVRGKLFWVFSKLAEKALLFRPAPAKEYVSGEGFHYLGRSYRLLLTDESLANGTDGLRLVGGRFVLPRKHQARATDIFIHWYTEHAEVWLRRRVQMLVPRVGKEPKDLRILDLGNRWGSCSSEGALNFHWKTIRLPPTLIEYVAAHELVHLLEPRHDSAFWDRLERVVPDWRARKRLLAESGSRY